MRPAAVDAGAAGSFLTAVAVRFVAAAGALAAGAFFVGAAFLAPDLVTIVVPALVALPSLSRPFPDGAADCAVPRRLVCLLGAREDGF